VAGLLKPDWLGPLRIVSKKSKESSFSEEKEAKRLLFLVLSLSRAPCDQSVALRRTCFGALVGISFRYARTAQPLG
jgi:hypothetical protein